MTTSLDIQDHLSPNFDNRPENEAINILVMHYTGMRSSKEALARLCDESAKVSSHYFIDEDGSILRLVPEEKRAWHAGISCWHGRSSVNDVSIGIEIVNCGHEFGYTEFTDKQISSVTALSKDILLRYDIPAYNVVGHSDIATNRKSDPGEYFRWDILAKHNIGIWPNTPKIKNPKEQLLSPGQQGEEVAEVQKMLSEYGYHIRVDGSYGIKMEATVRAFKRHFVQDQVNIIWDRKSDAVLRELSKSSSR